MKLLKQTTLIIIVFIIISTLVLISTKNNYSSNSVSAAGKIPKVGVLIFNFNDPHKALVKQSLENIEKENPNTIEFSFYDGKDNQALQNADIDNLIQNNVNLLLINLVDTRQSTISDIINKAKLKEIPIIFFDVEIPIDPKDRSKNVFVVTTDVKQSGILEGQILVDLWNRNKKFIDKNNDDILEYIMIQGKSNNENVINITNGSIEALTDNDIKVKKFESISCYWDKDCAKDQMSALFLRYGDNIEAIISNNDIMAIGAIEALQAYGYNKGDKTKTIPVVGMDGLPEAKDLVDKGMMAGTVAQDTSALANALYSIGLNLIHNRDPLEGTNYTLYKEGMVMIRFSYSIYKK